MVEARFGGTGGKRGAAVYGQIFQNIQCFVPMAGASVAVAAVGEHRPDARQIMMGLAGFVSKAPKWSVTVHSVCDVVQPDGYKV